MSQKKIPLEVSAKGVAAYAWLYKKDAKFAKKGEDGKYKLTIVIDKDEVDELFAGLEGGSERVTGTEWLEHLRDMHEKAGGDNSNSPVKDGDNQFDKKGKPKKKPNKDFFGKWTINFKTGYPAQLVDTQKNDLPDNVMIMSGDIVKAVYRPYFFDDGVSLRLNAVMLIDKRASFNSAGAFGDDEEGFVAEKSEGAAALGDADDDNDGDY